MRTYATIITDNKFSQTNLTLTISEKVYERPLLNQLSNLDAELDSGPIPQISPSDASMSDYATDRTAETVTELLSMMDRLRISKKDKRFRISSLTKHFVPASRRGQEGAVSEDVYFDLLLLGVTVAEIEFTKDGQEI